MTDDTLKVYSPYDEHLIAEIPMSGGDEIDEALSTARRLADDPSARLPLPKRIEILEKTRELVKRDYDEIVRLATEEGGKPLVDSRAEVTRAINGIKVAIDTLSHMGGEEIPMNLNAASLHRMAFTFREPIGVVVAVSAFNHPFNLLMHQAIPAVAVGCPAVVKPALKTPLSCFKLMDLLYEAGLPEQWCRAIVCSNELTAKMATDPRVDFLTFIGSAAVGWMLRSRLSAGTRCALEHGGAAPVIVEPDADLDDAVPLLTKGGFYHAGQVCVSVQRVFVHVEAADELAGRLAEAAARLKVGDPLDPETDVGPLITRNEVDRVDEWVKEAVREGAELMCGGQRIGQTCYAPTVLLDPPQHVRVSREEIFGPVVCVYRCRDRDEAVELANSLPFSFQAAVFTKNIDAALDVVRRIKAASVIVNDHTAFRVDWMPFGGRSVSGLGVGGIPYTMRDMTQEKLMVIRSPYL